MVDQGGILTIILNAYSCRPLLVSTLASGPLAGFDIGQLPYRANQGHSLCCLVVCVALMTHSVSTGWVGVVLASSQVGVKLTRDL